MSFQPPIRPTKTISPNTEPTGFLDSLAEKDDVLLYFTAFLGIVMPGVVYFVYHHVHSIYMKYAERKELERLKEEREKAEISIFYATEKEKGSAELRATELCTVMGDESPKLFNLKNINVNDFSKFKGFGVFIVDCLPNGSSPEGIEWFLDWLEDVAADAKQKKKTFVDQIRYCVLGICDSTQNTEAQYMKAAKTLHKRLKIVGAKDIANIDVIDMNADDETCTGRFNQWTLDVMDAIDGNNPNGSDSEPVLTESESESDLDDLEDLMEEDKRKNK